MTRKYALAGSTVEFSSFMSGQHVSELERSSLCVTMGSAAARHSFISYFGRKVLAHSKQNCWSVKLVPASKSLAPTGSLVKSTFAKSGGNS